MAVEQGGKRPFRGRRHQVGPSEYTGLVEFREPWMPLPREPHKSPCYDRHDIAAIKALRNGTATREQQLQAIGWIFYICGERDVLYRPAGNDVNSFVLGRHFVATMIKILTQINPESLAKQPRE